MGMSEALTFRLLDFNWLFSDSNFPPDNQIMEIWNLIHLTILTRISAHQTTYIPLIPPLSPLLAHLSTPTARLISFSEIFDIDGLADTIGTPIIEWMDIKKPRECCSIETPDGF
jgi:hypothetical protein